MKNFGFFYSSHGGGGGSEARVTFVTLFFFFLKPSLSGFPKEDGFKLVKSKKSSKKNKILTKVVPTERINEILSPEEISLFIK